MSTCQQIVSSKRVLTRRFVRQKIKFELSAAGVNRGAAASLENLAKRDSSEKQTRARRALSPFMPQRAPGTPYNLLSLHFSPSDGVYRGRAEFRRFSPEVMRAYEVGFLLPSIARARASVTTLPPYICAWVYFSNQLLHF